MLQSGAFIWSVSLSQIPFHLCHAGISTSFGVCVGYCFGIINRKLENLETKFGSCGDDVERSLRYMESDGLTLRYRMLYCETKFRAGQGGINSEIQNRQEQEIEAVMCMSQKWPKLITLDKSVKFKNGLPLKILRCNLPRNIPLQTSIKVPGILWVPPSQRPFDELPVEYKNIRERFKPSFTKKAINNNKNR